MEVRTGIHIVAFLLAVTPAFGQDGIPVPTARPDRPAATGSAAVPPVKAAAEATRARQIACPAMLSGDIKGELLPPLAEGSCGADSPIRVEAVAGVNLPSKPMMNCALATGLAAFAAKADESARRQLGASITELSTGPGYECRLRNRADSGKISEHAFANAIDLMHVTLSDGRQIAIGEHWPHGGKAAATVQAKFLSEIHSSACKLFSTVLGPDSNAAHHDHFHFDLGCHGRACTYLICE